eukprot:3224921-Amphidinium_carterae.2
MVSTTLGPMLVQGAAGANDVVPFCKKPLEAIPVDQVEMNIVSAACAKTAFGLYNALLATKTFQDDYKQYFNNIVHVQAPKKMSVLRLGMCRHLHESES